MTKAYELRNEKWLVEVSEFDNYLLRVEVGNGEVIEKTFMDLRSAQNSARYHLSKFDKQKLGAGAWVFKLEAAA